MTLLGYSCEHGYSWLCLADYIQILAVGNIVPKTVHSLLTTFERH